MEYSVLSEEEKGAKTESNRDKSDPGGHQRQLRRGIYTEVKDKIG